jgi:RNase P/RNase MRP subunit p29
VNVIGETLSVLSSSDPTKQGKRGLVVLETAKTLVIESGARTIMVEKAGTVFQVSGSGEVVAGSEIAGRLEDRLGARRR